MRPKAGGHFRPLTPEPSALAPVSAETTGEGGQGGSSVSVWAELSAVMSAALLRRGLELLGAPEGEEGLAGDAQRGRRTAGAAGRSPEGTGRSKPGLAQVGWKPCALSDPGPLLSYPAAPRAAPGQAKPSGAPAKRTRKAKATQAQKLRNSAKGKVPKDALGELGDGAAPWRRGPWRLSLQGWPGISGRAGVRQAQSRVLGVRRWTKHVVPALMGCCPSGKTSTREFQRSRVIAKCDEVCGVRRACSGRTLE